MCVERTLIMMFIWFWTAGGDYSHSYRFCPVQQKRYNSALVNIRSAFLSKDRRDIYINPISVHIMLLRLTYVSSNQIITIQRFITIYIWRGCERDTEWEKQKLYKTIVDIRMMFPSKEWNSSSHRHYTRRNTYFSLQWNKQLNHAASKSP